MLTIEVLRCAICGGTVEDMGPMVGCSARDMIHPDCLSKDPYSDTQICYSVVVTCLDQTGIDSDRFYMWADNPIDAERKAMVDCHRKWNWKKRVAVAKEGK